MIQIVSKKDGFRRGGIAHPDSPKTYTDEFFTADQLEEIENEPTLIVTHHPDPPKEKGQDEEKETRKVLEKKKLDQLKADCDSMGIEYPADATKAVLVDLILKNTEPVPEA